ncbi:MAG: hypothetical protein AUG48_08685 [Actinobacteria bacterium 13_1_20CM_3_68_9]|nr:MAG: hypothetical protein AUG48_08685 [Actinobacteria bacterium 13_1_20CM_3_68_9]
MTLDRARNRLMSMPTNGTRRPPRPRIELVTEAASKAEAAAVVAALEQFLAEAAPAPPAAGPAQSAWQRAALREAISARTEHGPVTQASMRAPGNLKATNRRTEWP